MNIQSVSSASPAINGLLETNTTKKISAQPPVKVSASSGDTLTIGEDTQLSEYVTYTSTGAIAGNEDSAALSGEPVINSNDAKPTDDEKWQSIISKYPRNGLLLDDYLQMLCDLASANLITMDELGAASSDAIYKDYCESVQLDMQDGILGNLSPSARSSSVDLMELLDGLQNNNTVYIGDPQKLENRQAFLKEFYTKISAYMNA